MCVHADTNITATITATTAATSVHASTLRRHHNHLLIDLLSTAVISAV
jgi:hypothetical protein